MCVWYPAVSAVNIVESAGLLRTMKLQLVKHTGSTLVVPVVVTRTYRKQTPGHAHVD